MDTSPPSRPAHWNRVYQEKGPEQVSWYQPSPAASLEAIRHLDGDPGLPFIDVGGGASNLVDHLLESGWADLTVLDIAAPALDAARSRLGERAAQVSWLVADITAWQPPRQYGLWHDRAVFHFLTDPAQRKAYRAALLAGTLPEAMVIIATFALDGPDNCSNLPVCRYDAAGLAAELGPKFALLESWDEEHRTPWGATQSFIWCAFRRQP